MASNATPNFGGFFVFRVMIFTNSHGSGVASHPSFPGGSWLGHPDARHSLPTPSAVSFRHAVGETSLRAATSKDPEGDKANFD